VLQAAWAIFLVLLFSVWDPNAPTTAPTVSSIGPIAGTSSVAAEIAAPVTAPTSGEEHSRRLKAAFDSLTDSVICAGVIFYGMAVAAVYILRRTRPDIARPYRTWGYPVTPALLLLAYLGAFMSLLMERPSQTFAVLGLIASGVAYYAFASRSQRRRPHAG
jgi:amino acid transporter